jgi:hypothetical protein
MTMKERLGASLRTNRRQPKNIINRINNLCGGESTTCRFKNQLSSGEGLQLMYFQEAYPNLPQHRGGGGVVMF